MAAHSPSIFLKSKPEGKECSSLTIIPKHLVMESPHHLKDESQNGGVFESSSFFTDDAKVRFFYFLSFLSGPYYIYF